MSDDAVVNDDTDIDASDVDAPAAPGEDTASSKTKLEGRAEADREVAEELVARARADGLELIGPDGVLTGLTKQVLEAGLEAEMSEHLGYDKHDPVGRNSGNPRNGTRTKTVITEIGPVELEVPRDRDGSFDPQLVRKRQRRLTGGGRADRLVDRQGPDLGRGPGASGRGVRRARVP